MKAYLAHCNADDVLVTTIADSIGRAQSIFYRRDFEIGEDFLTLMRNNIQQCAIFVYIASAAAKSSKPVQFELAEAERLHLIERSVQKAITFIVDDNVSFEDLPKWLQSKMVRRISAPLMIAQEIRHQLNSIQLESRKTLFVNRVSEVEAMEQRLLPVDGTTPPHIFSVVGLPGMGRRRLSHEIGKTRLSFSKSRIFVLHTGDDITELALEMATYSESGGTEDSLAQLHDEIKLESLDELCLRCIRYLRQLVDNHDLPVLHDDGGLLDGEGYIISAFDKLLSDIALDSKLYVAITARRPPQSKLGTAIPFVKVSALKQEDLHRLIAASSRALDIPVAPQDIPKLATHIYGHPPAVFFALSEISRIGIAAFLADKRRIIEWRTDYFTEALTADRSLTSKRKVILKLLAQFGPLPLQVLLKATLGAQCFGTPTESEWHDDLRYLIDGSLVEPDGLWSYGVPQPIADAVSRTTQSLNIDHRQLADALKKFLDTAQLESDQRLHLLRKFAAVSWLSGDKARSGRYFLLSDLLLAAKERFAKQDYSIAVELCSEYLVMQSESVSRGFTDEIALLDALKIKSKCQVKLRNYEDALESINEIRNINVREAFFLQGYLERRRQEFVKAATSFEEALIRGYRGVAIEREIAETYFFLNRLDDAAVHIASAYRLKPRNNFVVDLEAKIATLRDDEPLARSRLAVLEQVDNKAFYFFRKSVIDEHFHKPEDAYQAALNSVREGDARIVAHLEQLLETEIRTSRLNDAASTLRRLEQHPNMRPYIFILRGRWEIAKGQYDDALNTIGYRPGDNSEKYLHTRLLALNGSSAQLRLDDPRRSALLDEAADIVARLKARSATVDSIEDNFDAEIQDTDLED